MMAYILCQFTLRPNPLRMLYQLALVLILSIGDFTPDISMKSRLTPDMDQVMIEVQLLKRQSIGFDLKETDGKVIFRWKDQYLDKGTHSLLLKLPDNTSGKYLLSLNSESDDINHLLLIKK